MSVHRFFLHRGENACGSGGLFATQVVYHVAGNVAQVLEALGILTHVVRGEAVHHVPVAAGDDGHLRDGEVFLYLIQRGSGAGTAGGCHGGSGFMSKAVETAHVVGEEGAVQKCHERPACRSVMHWGADDVGIIAAGKLHKLVHFIIDNAAFGAGAATAGAAGGDGVRPDVVDEGLCPLCLKGGRHFCKGGVGAAIRPRGAIY